MVSFAIIRGSNGRRHEVNFEDAEITVDIAIGAKAVQVTIEAAHDQAPSHKRRFATLSLPREAFAAALGADLRERGGRELPGGLGPVREDGWPGSSRWASCVSVHADAQKKPMIRTT